MSISLGAGTEQSITVSVSGTSGFTGQINLSIANLPTGVTASPMTFTLAVGNQQQVILSAAASASLSNSSFSIQGTSGNLSHSVQVSLSISLAVSGSHANIRARYLRTNSFYDPNSLQFAPPHFTAYDAAHRQFYVSNPFLNEIDVFDAVQEIETAQIPVPSAWGIDISPTTGTLYAGTLFGDLYEVDTSTNAIVRRHMASSIGPNGYSVTEVFVLSDGRLALLGSQGGILGVDGAASAAIWDPTTNTLDQGVPSAFASSICGFSNIGAFAVTGDRKLVLMAGVDEGGAGETVCSYDPVAKKATLGAFPFATFVREIIPSPDGQRFFLTSNLDGVGVFDASTVQLIGQITGSNTGSIPNAAAGAVLSLDGKTLYLVDQSSGAVGAWDTTSLSQIGWISSFKIDDLQSEIVIAAIDETGLIVGPVGHGVGFLDATQLTATQPTFVNPGFASPSTGPTSGGTTISGFAVANSMSSSVLNQIFVGNVPGTNASLASASPQQLDLAKVTTPPATQTGAVDLTVLLKDGGMGIIPEGFSYGPTILEVVPNAASATGGQLGAIVGYGLGQTTSDVTVTVGGMAAPVTALHTSAPIVPYPFPAEALQFVIPAGTPGSSVDLTVTTSAGYATAKNAFHYVATVQSYPITAGLQEGIYDSHRNLYYFSSLFQIQVLARTTGTWLPPISLPGTSASTQLLAISESPNGSLLAVSDFGGQAIYVLNPDSSSSALRFPMPSDYLNQSLLAPSGLAVTDTGIVYFATADIGGTGTPAFHQLNTATGSISDLGTLQSGGVVDKFSRVLLSPDGQRVYSSIEGATFWLDTSNDQLHFSAATASNSGGVPDLTVSGDGSTVVIDGFFTDQLLNPETIPEYVDWETWFPTALTGQKLNQDGSIMFQPLGDGLDLIARNTGRLLYRVQLPVVGIGVYDSLVVGSGQKTVGFITGSGVSFVDLSTLTIPVSDLQPFIHH